MLLGPSSFNHAANPSPPEYHAPDGNLSTKAAQRLRRAIHWLDCLSPWQRIMHPEKKTYFAMKLNFLTLTLPAKQRHSDIEIKKQALNPFLTNIRKQYNLRAYIWRAEAQKNGNIHFHFVTNRFMHMHKIRRSWNSGMKRLGYVEDYRKAQLQWHGKQFRVREELLHTWSLEQQQRAYTHGVVTGWRDPNSTDIHSLTNVRNPAAYIAKYFSKKVTAKCPQCDYKRHYSHQPDSLGTCHKHNCDLIQLEERKIEGRLWFISQSLAHIKPLRLELSRSLETELYVHTLLSNKPIELDHNFTLYKLRPDECKLHGSTEIRKQFSSYCQSLQPAIV